MVVQQCSLKITKLFFYFNWISKFFSAFCSSGEEKSGRVCIVCGVGYFKDNNVDKFSMCTLCPVEKITANNGSTSETQCTVGRLVFFCSFVLYSSSVQSVSFLLGHLSPLSDILLPLSMCQKLLNMHYPFLLKYMYMY